MPAGARASVLVTGGAGFIGSSLVSQLVAAGHRVVVVDNLVNGRRENLDGALGPSCALIEADIRDLDVMTAALAGIEVVYHLACLGVRHSIHAPWENHQVNAAATLSLLGLSRTAQVSRFVYVSTSEVYGTAQWAPMSEAHPLEPTTVYGASKLAGEAYTRAYHRTYGLPTVVVRPFNAFGPRAHHEGDSGEVIPRFMLRCQTDRPMVVFGDGRQTRDFTFVDDTARGIVAAGLVPDAVGQTLNLGSGKEISISDLANEVAAVLGRPATVIYEPPRPGDVERLCADISRARRVLGFAPRVSFRDGLAQLKNWYAAMDTPAEVLLAGEVLRNWEGPPRA